MLALQTAGGLHAQDQPQRKLTKTVAPKYPAELKNQQLGGIVHLRVMIAPDGIVQSVKAVSGNRVLVEAAIEAVKQWKYQQSTDTDTVDVRIDFRPE